MNDTPEVRSQLEAWAGNAGAKTATIGAVDLRWLASDLTHVIVKLGCRVSTFDLPQREWNIGEPKRLIIGFG